jgi:hypothetical protein
VLDDTDLVVVIHKSVGGAHAITLPESPRPTQRLVIIDGKGDAGRYVITVTGDAINGGTSTTVNIDYGGLCPVRITGEWIIEG